MIKTMFVLTMVICGMPDPDNHQITDGCFHVTHPKLFATNAECQEIMPTATMSSAFRQSYVTAYDAGARCDPIAVLTRDGM